VSRRNADKRTRIDARRIEGPRGRPPLVLLAFEGDGDARGADGEA